LNPLINVHYMKKLLFGCAVLGLLCQSSFAASPLFAATTRVPDGGSTLGLLAVAMVGVTALARKFKR